MAGTDVSMASAVSGGFPKVFSLSKFSAKQYLEHIGFRNALECVPRHLQHVGVHKNQSLLE